MSKSIKFSNNVYIDAEGIAVNRKILADIMYPVGSIYISTVSTSPATLFGGSWTQITNRFLYAVPSSLAAKELGGENSHTLTINEMPSHSHNLSNNGTSYRITVNAVTGQGGDNYNMNYTSRASENGPYVIADSVGGGQAHNNMPQYFTCYAWYRTA